MPRQRPAPDRPIHVLHLTTVEASNYYLNNLVDFSDRAAVEFSAVTFGAPGPFVAELRRRGLSARALDCGSPARLPLALPRLIRVIRTNSIDILHGHLFWPSLISGLLGRLLGRAVVITRHHSDAVHKIQGRLRRSVFLGLDAWTNRLADHIIAPSSLVRQILLEREGVPAGKVSLIPYGQRPERFALAQRTSAGRSLVRQQSTPSRVRFAPSSREGALVSLRSLLRPASVRRRCNAPRGGDGSERQTLVEEAGLLGIAERVRFLGWRDDALEIMAAADLVVHPSLHEALPSAVIEAVLLARPVVASDVSGVRDILGDSAFGTVVPPADSSALFRALLDTIRDLASAQQKAARGRIAVLDSMAAARVAREYEACYRTVVTRRNDR